MKKSYLLLATGLLFTTLIHTYAAVRAPSNEGRDYPAASSALSLWSIGGYFHSDEKDLDLQDRGERTLSSTRAMFYVGYDLLSWLTPYLTIGQSQTEIDSYSSGEEPQIGLGASVQLLDHEVDDPTLLEDRIRLNGNIEYSWTSAEYMGSTLDWTAFDASLTLSVVNDVFGNIRFAPDSIALFGGPIYSAWFGSDIDGPAHDRNVFGYCLGLEVFYTPSVSLNFRANILESTGLTAGLNIHF